jgi:hypothetical protein
MQFTRAGNRIQVRAYRGYNKEKKRSDVKLLGSLEAYTYEPSDDLLSNMTDDEKKELQSYIEKERLSYKKTMFLTHTKYAASQLVEIANALRSQEFSPGEEWAAEMFDAMSVLTKALAKRGYKRGKLADVRQASLLVDGNAPR